MRARFINEIKERKNPLDAIGIGTRNIIQREMESDDNFFIEEHSEDLLVWSVYSNNLKYVKWLIEHGDDVNGNNEDGTAFILACQRGHLEIVKYLIVKGVNIFVDNEQPLKTSCVYGRDKVVKVLIKNGSKPQNQPMSLYYASSNGYTEGDKESYTNTVKLLIDTGIDVNMYNVLIIACNFKATSIIELLMDAGINVENQIAALKHVCSVENYKNYKIAELLLKKGVKITSKIWINVITHGSEKLKKLFNKYKNNYVKAKFVNEIEQYHDPLDTMGIGMINTIKKEYEEYKKVTKNAETNILMRAITIENFKYIEHLINSLKNNINFTKFVDWGLLYSIRLDNIEIAKLFIKNGANVNGGKGWMLQEAILLNFPNMVKFLIENGTTIFQKHYDSIKNRENKYKKPDEEVKFKEIKKYIENESKKS